MTKKIKFAYCSICKKEVEKSSRKPLDTMEKLLWIIVIIATLGIGAIAYVIYLSNKPKVYCPTCFTKLEYSDKPFVKPKKKREDMTPKERVLDKTSLKEGAEKEDLPVKNKKEKKQICPYCGATLDKEYTNCPFCQVSLKS
jgi:hypothetical protein